MDGLLNRPNGHRPRGPRGPGAPGHKVCPHRHKLKIEQRQHLKVLLYLEEMQKAYKESNAKEYLETQNAIEMKMTTKRCKSTTKDAKQL